MTYVGFVTKNRSLIQIDTQLIMINHRRLATTFFYQLCLDRFANFPAFEFKPIRLESILNLSLKSTGSNLDPERMRASGLVEHACSTLTNVSEMLKCYFTIVVDENGIHRLPVILEGLRPRVGTLPLFLLRLATDVDYNDEKKCFKKICQVISEMYAESCDGDSLKNIVFPAARKRIKVPKSFDEIMVKLTSTEELYKVFERC